MKNHFYQNIQGWFDFDNIYRRMVEQAHNNSHFVEVGTWKGKSASYMCVEIANSGKKIKFDCVDIWTGAGGVYDNDSSVKNKTLYEEFISNMDSVKEFFTPIRDWSDKAAINYEDNSLDFVFIDAGHDYENIRADIDAWLPKIKNNGYIGGHDFTSASGVRKAVLETFSNPQIDRTSWIIQKK